MTLDALLHDGARFDAEYRGGLSNHLPMALVALQRLGAPDERLDAFAATYAQRLHAAAPPAPWPAGEAWTAHLGQVESWPAYRSLFGEWLEWEEAGDVLRQVLPGLMTGCGAAAFHGLIRTAYAVRAGHRSELADGLAYWACRHLPLGDAAPAPVRRERDPAGVLQRVQRAVREPLPEHALIFERMQAAARQPGFAAAVARLKIDAGTLERLARHAAGLYAASGNFTALHLVTSAHALRVLQPQMEDPLAAVAHYWQAYAAGFAASGAQAGEPPAPMPWAALLQAAIASDDDHVIKLVDSCREQEMAYGEASLWRAAATRAVLKDAAPAPPGTA